MNPYYYLFYKLNRFLNKKGDNEWGPIGAVTLFVGWNIGIFYTKMLLPLVQESYQDKHKYLLGIIVIILFVGNSLLFLNKKRVNKIIERYQKESDIGNKIGNFLVILYMVLSIASIVFI